MKKPTIMDVANLAGVSKSTVSAYLNQRYHFMSGATKLKIQKAIETLNYEPNALARGLRQKKQQVGVIGLVVGNMTCQNVAQWVRAIQSECQAQGVQVIICDTDDVAEQERICVNQLLANQVEGLIVFAHEQNSEIYGQLLEQNYPLVFAQRKIPGLDVPVVLCDDSKATQLAMEYLIEYGHERIVLLMSVADSRILSHHRDMEEGYEKALRNSGMTHPPEYIIRTPTQEMVGALTQLFSGELTPTAVLATSSGALEQLLIFAKKQGYSIPEQLSIMGIDNSRFTAFFQPAISVISYPVEDMGKQSAKILLEKIAGTGDIPVTYLYPPTLKQRESVTHYSKKS